MEVRRTIQIGLQNDPDIRNTVFAAQRVQQALSPTCFNGGKVLDYLRLQTKAYKGVKGVLSSQLTISCIRLVAAAYASAKSNRRPATRAFKFAKPRALFLVGKRGRDADFRKDGTLSIWTVGGRKRVAYTVPERFKPVLASATEVDAITIIVRDGVMIAKVAITVIVPDPEGSSPVGIDLNATNALVAVDAADRVLFISGREIRERNARTRKTKSRLQRKLATRKAEEKDTRSVRRLLKRLGRRQRNRTRTFCQTAAKRLVEWAPKDAVFVFERLKRMKQVSKKDRMRKGTRRKLSHWPRGLLRSCVENKAEERGNPVADREPAYTSVDCSRCGEPGHRWQHRFLCESCGHAEHADVNAARNVRDRFTILRGRGAPSAAPEAR